MLLTDIYWYCCIKSVHLLQKSPRVLINDRVVSYVAVCLMWNNDNCFNFPVPPLFFWRICGVYRWHKYNKLNIQNISASAYTLTRKLNAPEKNLFLCRDFIVVHAILQWCRPIFLLYFSCSPHYPLKHVPKMCMKSFLVESETKISVPLAPVTST